MNIPFGSTGRDGITTANYAIRFFKMPWNPCPVNFFVQILRNPVGNGRLWLDSGSFNLMHSLNAIRHHIWRIDRAIPRASYAAVAKLRCESCMIRRHLLRGFLFLDCVLWGVLLRFDSHCTDSTSGVDLKQDPI
jgi:hypothetical protein